MVGGRRWEEGDGGKEGDEREGMMVGREMGGRGWRERRKWKGGDDGREGERGELEGGGGVGFFTVW
jgi:hypothetical protein